VSSKTQRYLGILFLVIAATVAVLNLKRVAGLGMTWLPAIFLILGIVLVAKARRGDRVDQS